jgi:acetoin utilization deacetylase AcuC-like enzyme
MTSNAWRQSFVEIVLPRLRLFKPDFMFISAGFDAHLLDPLHAVNASQLTELDYQWITLELMKIANTYS